MILEEIRKQTSENHHRLEQSDLLHSITSPSLIPEHYFKTLRIFYGYFYPVEKEINKFRLIKQYLPDFDKRRKAALIREDLLNLKAIQPEEPLEMCHDLPEIKTASQAFGCLYVLEGSTLGGKIIARSLKKNLGLDQSHGASFFYGYGQETGTKWKAFQQALTSFSLNFREDHKVIKAANEAFYKLEVWISKN